MRSDSEERGRLYDSSLDPAAQREALTGGDVPVAVYGLGKMGLPLATVYAEMTGNTIGADVDADVVAAVNRGECPVAREPGLPSAVADAVAAGALEATDDPVAAARRAHIHVVIVPTLVTDEQPDLSTFRAAVESIASGLDAGDLVIVESTVPPRTCADVVVPTLASESQCAPGEFGVAFCPERTASGRALRDVRGAYPKVVGGVDGESTRAAALCYDELSSNDVYTVTDATTAECVKVFEGLYRDVNIALANELATLADEIGVDVRDAIDVANTQPYCDIHDPGPGVGGHCIPYYPYFVIAPFRTATPLLRTARDVNDGMPSFTVEKVREKLQANGVALDSSTIAVLGLAYRPGVNETRKSAGVAIARLLEHHGATVYAVDPVVDVTDEGFRELTVGELAETDVDAIVLATAHDEFQAIDWGAFDGVVIVDGHDVIDAGSHPQTYTIGVGNQDGHPQS